ncbi:MAG: DUF3987 domain-containing protein [Bacteroidales bacterium]|jgi:hypothetical protein
MNFTEAASCYIDNGFNPIPLRATKSPALKMGHDYLSRRFTDVTPFRDCDMIGVVCGDVSSGLECMDFDGHGGGDIRRVFNDFMRDPLILEITRACACFRTPSGGYHVIYRCQSPSGGCKLAAWENGEVMVEVRGSRQYIACAPSSGYKHVHGVELVKVGLIEDQERGYLHGVARSLGYSPGTGRSRPDGGTWGASWVSGTPFGKLNDTGGQLARDALLEAGWVESYSRADGVIYLTRPGKDGGTSATFGARRNMFYVFSSSAAPFEADTAYSPADVLLKLKFNSNMGALREWVTENYGDQPTGAVVDLEERLPGFPVDVFPPLIRGYIAELSTKLNFSVDFISIAVLSAIATVNGNKYKLRVKNGWVAPTIFWFVAVGDRGTMKTHPISTVLKPLHVIDGASKKIFDEQIREFERAGKKAGRRPKFRQIVMGDTTLEAVIEALDYNRRGVCLYKDEIIGFINDMNKYRKGSDEQFWLESFNNNSYTVNRVSKDPLHIDNICVNIIGSIQTDTLAGVMCNHVDNGFFDRFLYTRAETEIHPLGLADPGREWFDFWDTFIMQLNDQVNYMDAGDTVLIELEQGGLSRMIEIDRGFINIQLSNDEHPLMKSYVSKMKTYLPRFALVMGIIDAKFSDGVVRVGVDQVDKAGELCDYFMAAMRSVFRDVDSVDEISRVVSTMQASSKIEKIMKLHTKGYKQKDIAKVLKSPRSYVSRVVSKKG